MPKPSLATRAKIAWSVFRKGFPAPKLQLKKKGDPFTWPAWREMTPAWRTDDFGAYVEEGFNRNTLIYSAIMYKVRSKMSAPLRAYGDDPNNPAPLPADHPLSRLVARPNPYQSFVEFHALNEIYFNLGNSFIFFKRPKKGGLPEAMYSLRPDRVWVIPKDGGLQGYLYVPEGQPAQAGLPILPQDMMHVKLPNPSDPLEGLGYGMPPSAIGRSTDVDNDITTFLKLFFQNGAMPLGLLSYDMPLADEDVAFIKDKWRDIYGGVENWAEVAVLDKNGKYQRLGANFDEMGFEALDERNESRILGPLGVPPILIGSRLGLMRSTYSNYAEARRAYWEDTAIPEQTLFETNYQYYLTTEDGGFVKFDRSKVPALQKDIPKLVAAAKIMWSMGTPANLAYQAVGLNVGEIPGGDIGYLPSGLVPVGLVPEEADDDNQGAPDAEDDERGKAMLPGQRKQAPNDEMEKMLAQYQTDIGNLVEQALADEITQEEFRERMEQLVDAVLLALFLLGADLGSQDELVPAELADLEDQLDIEREAVVRFADDIYVQGRYENDETGRASALGRVALWVATAASVYAMGQVLKRTDPKLRWVFRPEKVHCADCARLDGQVHRASEWLKSGWQPQSRSLACGGWRCGCRFEEVEEGTPISGSFAHLPNLIRKHNGYVMTLPMGEGS